MSISYGKYTLTEMRRILEERDRFQREKRELEEVMKKSFIEEKNRQIKKMFDSQFYVKTFFT